MMSGSEGTLAGPGGCGNGRTFFITDHDYTSGRVWKSPAPPSHSAVSMPDVLSPLAVQLFRTRHGLAIPATKSVNVWSKERPENNMHIETKYLRLRTPVTLGSRFDDWSVVWIGGWTNKYKLCYLVMVMRVNPDAPFDEVCGEHVSFRSIAASRRPVASLRH
jgi:hypothetical protein